MSTLADPAALAMRVTDGLPSGAGVGIAVDYDGTLVPIQPRPEDAVASAELLRLLARLVEHPRLQFAVVSGRSLADLEARLPLEGGFRFGSHGGRGRGPGFSRISTFQSRPALEAVEDLAKRAMRETWPSGAWVEDKGVTVALHYRQASNERVGRARDRFRILHGKSDPGHLLELMEGRKVLEARPIGLHKGLAVRWLKDHLAAACHSWIYVGDDTTDEDAFRALGPDDWAVVVSPSPRSSTAETRLQDPGEVARFLRSLLEDPSLSPIINT